MFSEAIDIAVVKKDFAPGTVAGQYQIKVTDAAGVQVFEYHADEDMLIDDIDDGMLTIAIDIPAPGVYKFEAWRKDAAGNILKAVDGTDAYTFAMREYKEPQKVVIAVPVAITFNSPAPL